MLGQLFRRIYIRPPEPIPSEHRRLLLLVGAAMFIAAYDVNIYGLASRQIQASFAIPEEDIGRVIVVFRLGMIPALFLAYLSDVIGRRALLMLTLAGASIATIWTAFAQTLPEFLAAQTLARVCIYTEEMLCVVVIAEEFSERTRGWAIGQLGAIGALGAGGAALMFGFVSLLPFGWRAIYFIGAIPLLWLLWARRSLTETKRFQERAAHGGKANPLVSLIRNYPGRLGLVIGVAATYAFAMASTVTLFSAFLQKTHGWLPWQVTVLTLGAGLIAILGNTIAGTLSDRYGRKIVLAICAIASAVGYALFFGWAQGWWLVLLWTIALFTFMATDILIASLGAELFPTSHRTFAASIRFFASLGGGSIGLLVEAEVFHLTGSHGSAIAIMTLAAPLCLIPIWFLPEPAKKALEEIAAERT